ncbi:MAG: response regulator transcription factor [Rectinema sp.]
MMLSILVADDHYLIRKGLRQLLEENLPTLRVDEAGDGREALEAVRSRHYDVVVLDISMPGRDGLDLIRDIKDADPVSSVLILSIQPEEQYALRAFRLGAAGCLNKAGNPAEVVQAVRTVVSGKRYLNSKTQELLLDDVFKDGSSLPHQRLSDREFQVFMMLASGRTAGEISGLLNISVKTVSTYRTRIIEKTGLENNAQITHYAFKQGLVGDA